MGLPRVGIRPLGESFWTRRDACSEVFGGMVETGGLTDGDIVLAFLWGGSLDVVEDEVI